MIFKQKYKKTLKILILAYIVFSGCFSFPIHSEQFPLKLMRVYLFIAQYGIIGTSLAGLYREMKCKFVYIATLLLTTVGLLCRYLLEFGEVSNTYNFTLPNIVSYLVIIPIGVLITYFLSSKTMQKKEEET